MAQFEVTPWRDVTELIAVRSQFYPLSSMGTTPQSDNRRQAIDLVRAWKMRGNLPHAVESTAFLVDAVLNDAAHVSPWCVRAAYATAVARFVTGLIDSNQTDRYKRSMYSVAQDIGLPASFVELRHQVTHDELPSLVVLRQAAERSLAWLWQHFWANIGDVLEKATQDAGAKDAAKEELVKTLREGFRDLLRSYVKDRLRDYKARGDQAQFISPSEEKDITKEICKACARACIDDSHTLAILASVLSETKFLIPANRTLSTPMKPAFAIWEPLLKELIAHQRHFLRALLDELLRRLTVQAPQSASHELALDPYYEAVYLWLRHILADDGWANPRRKGRVDLDSVVARCLVDRNTWSVRLARDVINRNDEDADLKHDWGDLVERAEIELEDEQRLDPGARLDGAASDSAGEDDVSKLLELESELEDEGNGDSQPDTWQRNPAKASESRIDDGPGWKLWTGPWIPRPIGVV